MNDFTEVNTIIQQMIERTSGKVGAAGCAAIDTRSSLAANLLVIQEYFQLTDTSQPHVETKYLANCSSFALVHNQSVVNTFVSQRDHASHPHPFFLRGRNFVPYSLSSDFAFELGERQQHVERESSHRGRSIKLLGYR